MSDSSYTQMMILMGFVFVLLLAIFGTIIFSVLKKKKSNLKNAPTDEVSLPSSTKPMAKNITELTANAVSVQTHVEKEITVAEALAKTEQSFFGRIRKAFSGTDKKIVLDEIEEILYTSDLGPMTVEKLLAAVKAELSRSEISDIQSVKQALQRQMNEILSPIQNTFEKNQTLEKQIVKAAQGPTVLMIVGVNGAGKTTSIGKITAQLAKDGKKILVAAGDTFRAAAGSQLKVWTDRAQEMNAGQVEIFWPLNTTDPSAVAFDSVQKAKAQNYDYVILDTAGRLHTQANLMEELKKVKRVMAKIIPEAPHEIWIVLDANSGQNALLQAKEFHQALTLTGVVLTKMDGTAKGGVALGLVDQLEIPIKLIGVGEKVSDLRLFKQSEYVSSILGL